MRCEKRSLLRVNNHCALDLDISCSSKSRHLYRTSDVDNIFSNEIALEGMLYES